MTVNGVPTACSSSLSRRSASRHTRRSRVISRKSARSCKAPRSPTGPKADANISSIEGKIKDTLAPELLTSTVHLSTGANAPCEITPPTAIPQPLDLCSVIEDTSSQGALSSPPTRPPPPSTPPPPPPPPFSAPPAPHSVSDTSAEPPQERAVVPLQVDVERSGCRSALRAPAANSSTSFSERAAALKRWQRRVQFDLDSVEVHEVDAYSMIYGLHPREFVFDRRFHMVPAKGFTSMVATTVEADDDSSDTSDSDSEEDCDYDTEDAWNIVFH